MEKRVPCGPVPPLIPADSTVGGRRGRRSSPPPDTTTGSRPGEIGVAGTNDGQDCLCSLLWHAQQDPGSEHCINTRHKSPGVDQCCHARHNTANNLLGNDGRWLTEENSLSPPPEALLLSGSGGETPPSGQRSSTSGTNGLSPLAEWSPLVEGGVGGPEENGCDAGVRSVDSARTRARLSSAPGGGSGGGVLLVCRHPQQNLPGGFGRPASLADAGVSITSVANTDIGGSKRKNEKTLANNLAAQVAARPKEQPAGSGSVPLTPCHHQQYQRRPNAHRHLYAHDPGRPQTVNIPVVDYSGKIGNVSNTNQNSLSSVLSNSLSITPPLVQPRCENAILCPTLKSDPPQIPVPPPTTMPYNNCLPFKQGPLVHGNGPMNGNMVCSPKCCTASLPPNGFVISTPDFKSMDVNKMSPQQTGNSARHDTTNNARHDTTNNARHDTTNNARHDTTNNARHHLNNNYNNLRKHSSVAELVNYKNGHPEALSGGTSNTKTVLLLQSNLNSSQPPLQQQHYHTCKSLVCEKPAGGTAQANNPGPAAPISSSSQVPTGGATSSHVGCDNCSNPSVKSLNNANVSPSGTTGTNGGKMVPVSKKCKAFHNLQCKFQKNRFISSLQECCRACNSYDGCRGSTESLELEAGLLCPSYSYCDSDNVASTPNAKDQHNYKNQLASLVNERPSPPNGALALGRSNNNCSAAPAAVVNRTLAANALSSGQLAGVGFGVDTREDDFGDFIEPDFPPVPAPVLVSGGRLLSTSTDSTESCSSLTGSDMHDADSPNPHPAGSPLNNIATLLSGHTASHGRAHGSSSSLCSTTIHKNCDYKTNNNLTASPAPPTLQAIAGTDAAPASHPSPHPSPSPQSPVVTGANPSLKKCPSKKTPPPPFPVVDNASGIREQQQQASSSVIKKRSFEVSKVSSSSVSPPPPPSPSPSSSSSSSSPSSASYPTCSFLCSGDRHHSHVRHKAEKNGCVGGGSRHASPETSTTNTNTNRSSSSGVSVSFPNNSAAPPPLPLPLPLAGIGGAATASPSRAATPPQASSSSATFSLSPEVDFLDFDLATPPNVDLPPNLDPPEQNVNGAGGSWNVSGTRPKKTGFDLSLFEIPYADDVDSACPSPVEDLVLGGVAGTGTGTSPPVSLFPPNMVLGGPSGSGSSHSPNMAAGGGSQQLPAPLLVANTNCATNDLSASSSNSNLSGRSAAHHLEDHHAHATMLTPGQSNFEAVRARVQNAFSNLYMDYRDDVSVDSEETGSHDSNEISEGDDQQQPSHPHHHHNHHHHRFNLCGMTHSPANGSPNNNLLLLSPDSPASGQDVDLRDNPGVSEPIYEDIDGVHLDKCTADSPGDKCSCVSPDSLHKTSGQLSNMQHSKKPPSKRRPSSVERVMIWDENQVYRMQVKQTESDVSACGPIAVLNVLNAFDYPVEKSRVLEKAPVNLRETSAPIAQYLFSRAKAGTTAEALIKCVESVTNGAIRGRFFDFHPQRDVDLLKWLGDWMKKDAVPMATLNIQKSVRPGWAIPDSWHHQMIYGVSSKGVYLTNPLKLVGEENLLQQLNSDRILLVRRFDIISRFNDETNLSQLMTPHKDADRWRTMNVLGQVVNVLREASMPRFPGYRPQLTQHIQIPAAYRAGITLFVRTDGASGSAGDAYHELMNAPDLPLLRVRKRRSNRTTNTTTTLPHEVTRSSAERQVDGEEWNDDEEDEDDDDDEEASGGLEGSFCPDPLPCDHVHHRPIPGEPYNYYEYADNNYYSTSSSTARNPSGGSGGLGPASPPDFGVGAPGLHHHHHYGGGGARHFGNHGYPRRNNVYIHYFNT